MTEWIFNLKTKLTVLVMMLCSLCVTKVYAVELGINECAVTSGQNINLRSINLTTDDFKPGPDSVIYTINQDAVFKCYMGYCVFRSIRSRIGIEVRSAIRIHSINR
ncbi:hypothetical protein M5F54_04710, partial [Salmonella enterica]|nr:hypothetical protein [Salmonella enterica]